MATGQYEEVKIIFYAAENEPDGERLLEVITGRLPKVNIKICPTMEELSQSLRRPLPDPVIIILLVTSNMEFFGILHLRNILHDQRIILILSDDDADTLAMGHMLRPRYLTISSRDFADVSTVLERMASAYFQATGK